MVVRTRPFTVATRDTRAVRVLPKVADDHYLTPEHKAWSKAVIARAGNRCEGKRHNPAKPRSGIRLYADHIIERRDGGALLDPRNGQALCGSCHGLKTMAERSRRMAKRDPGQ